jgi:hypothetical protein
MMRWRCEHDSSRPTTLLPTALGTTTESLTGPTDFKWSLTDPTRPQQRPVGELTTPLWGGDASQARPFTSTVLPAASLTQSVV